MKARDVAETEKWTLESQLNQSKEEIAFIQTQLDTERDEMT